MYLIIACCFAICVVLLICHSCIKPVVPLSGCWRNLALFAAVPLLLAYAGLSFVTARPFLSCFVVIGLLGVISAVSRSKFCILKEPFLYSDIILVNQAISHPALYIKFVGLHRVLLIGFILTLTFVMVLLAEQSFVLFFNYAAQLVAGLLLFCGCFFWCRSTFLSNIAKADGCTGSIFYDVHKFSVLGAVGAYATLHAQPINFQKYASMPHSDADECFKGGSSYGQRYDRKIHELGGIFLDSVRANKPHLVAVQIESFCDIREFYSEIKPSILSNFDKLKITSKAWGRLEVDSWGANTMRSEFGFLTGLSPDALGVHRCNPLMKMANTQIWTIARHLKDLGYRCVIIHPYYSSFFGRDRAYPALGFDQFIDRNEFKDTDQFGPYVSDYAVAKRIEQILCSAEEPTFIFAITMENHGMWSQGRLSPQFIKWDLCNNVLDVEFAQYLTHIQNSDRMIGKISSVSDRLDVPVRACFFGDHQPPLECLKAGDSQHTHYLITE